MTLPLESRLGSASRLAKPERALSLGGPARGGGAPCAPIRPRRRPTRSSCTSASPCPRRASCSCWWPSRSESAPSAAAARPPSASASAWSSPTTCSSARSSAWRCGACSRPGPRSGCRPRCSAWLGSPCSRWTTGAGRAAWKAAGWRLTGLAARLPVPRPSSPGEATRPPRPRRPRASTFVIDRYVLRQYVGFLAAGLAGRGRARARGGPLPDPGPRAPPEAPARRTSSSTSSSGCPGCSTRGCRSSC